MVYNEEVRAVAIKTLRLMSGEKKWEFATAFGIAFRESEIDSELYHAVRIGVKSFFRSWKEEKRKREEKKILIGALNNIKKTHEKESPLH